MKEVLTILGVGIALAGLMVSFQSQTQSHDSALQSQTQNHISGLQSQMESQFATVQSTLDRLDERGYELNERLTRIESQVTN